MVCESQSGQILLEKFVLMALVVTRGLLYRSYNNTGKDYRNAGRAAEWLQWIFVSTPHIWSWSTSPSTNQLAFSEW